MENSNSPQLITIYQAANLLAVSTRTIRRMVQDGDLPTIKIRGNYRFRVKDIEQLVNTEVDRSGQTWTNVDKLR